MAHRARGPKKPLRLVVGRKDLLEQETSYWTNSSDDSTLHGADPKADTDPHPRVDQHGQLWVWNGKR
eukprot:2762486-Amphidinium_carterae.1